MRHDSEMRASPLTAYQRRRMDGRTDREAFIRKWTAPVTLFDIPIPKPGGKAKGAV